MAERTLEEIMQEVNRIRNEARAKASEAITLAFDALFMEYPDLESVSWTQYTPYFNDGDTCTFSVNWDYIDVEFLDDESPVEGESWYSQEPENRWDKVATSFSEIGRFIDDRDMEYAFGDHVRVTMVRQKDGTIKSQTEETYHD